MSYEKALKELAPCGIDCSRCVSYEQGDVVRLSKELNEKLTNFEHMAKRIEDFAPIFKDYDKFLSILQHFSQGKCPGCRYGETPNMSCITKNCHKEKEVDFCFQCQEYPCTKNNYNENLYSKWKNNNDMMKKYGVEVFYNDQKKKSRY